MIFNNRILRQGRRIVVTLIAFLAAGFAVCELMYANESGTEQESRSRTPKAITIATWNLEWFFDDNKADNHSDISRKQSSPSAREWQWKKRKVADVIAAIKPTIVCLQEVENRDVIFQLAKQLEKDHKIKYRYAFISGYDFATEQDVAILYQSGLVEFSRREQTREMYESGEYYNLSKHMFARFEWGSGDNKEGLTIFNGHLRATSEKRDLRIRQSRVIRAWLDERIKAGENVIITGDINTDDDCGDETLDGPVAILRGKTTDSANDDLLDVNSYLPEDSRATHISGRQYDRIFYSKALADNTPRRKDLVFNRVIVRRDLVVQGEIDQNHWDGLYDIPQSERDISDHYPLVAEFVFK